MFRFTFTIFPSLHPNFGVLWENMGLEPPPPLICRKTMTTDQQPIKTYVAKYRVFIYELHYDHNDLFPLISSLYPIKTNIYFSHFSDNFFHIFPYPNPNFGASWEEMGMNQRCFPFFHIPFFHFSHPYIYIAGILEKKWGWIPSFQIHYSHPQIQISTRFGKKWS